MQTIPLTLHRLYNHVVHLCEGRSAAEIEVMFDTGAFALNKLDGTAHSRVQIFVCLRAACRNGTVVCCKRFM